MKFQLHKDTVVETIADGMRVTDVINAKVNSIGREVCCSLVFINFIPLGA